MSLYTIVYPDIRKGEKEPSGGFVEIEQNYAPRELEQNLVTAICMARHGYKVRLLNVRNNPGVRNPDAYLLEEKIHVEFKLNLRPTRSAIDSELRKAKDQAEYIVLDMRSKIRKSDLINALTNRLNRARRIRLVWIIWQGRVRCFSRKEILERSFREKIE